VLISFHAPPMFFKTGYPEAKDKPTLVMASRGLPDKQFFFLRIPIFAVKLECSLPTEP